MRPSHARVTAVAITPFIAAFLTLRNSASSAIEMLYGTAERTRGTITVTLLLCILSLMLQYTAIRHGAGTCASPFMAQG